MMENSVNSTEEEDETSSSADGSAVNNSIGWGGWSFSPFSLLSDIQKAATVAAEEISRNAVAAVMSATESIPDLKNPSEVSKQVNKDAIESRFDEGDGDDDENEKLRKSIIDKLGNAGSDTLLGQGMKAFDHSVENLTSSAWLAIGSAFKGGSDLIHRIEDSAAHIANSIHPSSLPETAISTGPSLLETGRALTAKGMEVLELVGKEAMELLVIEPGINQNRKHKNSNCLSNDDHLSEHVTFDGCFYIYGGPEQMEELEALSNHYALLYNRRKAKLESEQKLVLEAKLKQVRKILDIGTKLDRCDSDTEKGKQKETISEGSDDETQTLHDSSVRQAADLALGFATILAGLEGNEIIQKTVRRLDSLHSEGVHRVSEICCFTISHLVLLGKSVISNADKAPIMDGSGIELPEGCVERANIIRTKAWSMASNVEAVSNSFITGISDVKEVFEMRAKGLCVDPRVILDRAGSFSDHLRADYHTAFSKIQDTLHLLSFLLLS